MRVLAVLAHPHPESFGHAVFATAVDALRRAGHQVATLDLYAEDVRAHMTAEERRAYHSDHPVLDPQVAAHIEQLRAADALVLVYPTWWSSLPAILKGWLERTMVPGVGFVFHPRTHKVRPGLTNVRHIVGISTYGSSWRYVKLINDNGRRTLLRALRMSTGRGTRCHWLALYSMDSATDEQRRAFLTRVAERLGSLR